MKKPLLRTTTLTTLAAGLALTGLALTGLTLMGCVSTAELSAKPEAPLYRCENDISFTVRFSNDSATLNSNRGYEALSRTLPTTTGSAASAPGQTVYANRTLRAEFGLGTGGRGAVLRYTLEPLVVRCNLQ